MIFTLAYAGLAGLRALEQHQTNGWQLSWPDEQNDIGITSFVDVGPQNCRKNASFGPTNDCYLGSCYADIKFFCHAHLPLSQREQIIV